MSQITEFYAIKSPDEKGRMLFHLLGFQDRQLEHSDDVFQWLFPTAVKSKFFPDAPVLNKEDISSFQSNPELIKNLSLAYARFLTFLGLKLEGTKVVKGENFEARHGDVWSCWNHNFPRITRAISCLQTLGLTVKSWALYEGVLDVCGEDIAESTRAFLTAAATGKEMPKFAG
jgi:hypothetical protein